MLDQIICASGKRDIEGVEQGTEFPAKSFAGVKILGVIGADIENNVGIFLVLNVWHNEITQLTGGGRIATGNSDIDGA